MPLLPHLLSPFVGYGFTSLFISRVLYGIASLLLGLLIFHYSNRRSQNVQIALGAYSLYILNGFMISWHSVVQFNALTDLLSFSAFLLLIKSLDENGRKSLLFLIGSGILLGLVVGLRIVFLPFLFLLILFLIFFKEGIKKILYF